MTSRGSSSMKVSNNLGKKKRRKKNCVLHLLRGAGIVLQRMTAASLHAARLDSCKKNNPAETRMIVPAIIRNYDERLKEVVRGLDFLLKRGLGDQTLLSIIIPQRMTAASLHAAPLDSCRKSNRVKKRMAVPAITRDDDQRPKVVHALVRRVKISQVTHVKRSRSQRAFPAKRGVRGRERGRNRRRSLPLAPYGLKVIGGVNGWQVVDIQGKAIFLTMNLGYWSLRLETPAVIEGWFQYFFQTVADHDTS